MAVLPLGPPVGTSSADGRVVGCVDPQPAARITASNATLDPRAPRGEIRRRRIEAISTTEFEPVNQHPCANEYVIAVGRSVRAGADETAAR